MTFSFKKVLFTLLFFLGAAVVLSWNTAAVPLFEPDEGRYADMALTMVKTGDWIIPRMNYIVHLHKPPLSSWLVATSFKFLGPTEWTARLPNLLLSLGALFLVMQLGKLLFDFKTGIFSALILLNAPLYVAVSRLVTPDMLLTFLNLLAMLAIAHLFFPHPHPSPLPRGEGDKDIPSPSQGEGRVRGKLIFFYTAAIAIGLGMLTKGPVAWMMPLLPTFIFAFWKKVKLDIPLKHWLFAALVMLSISCAWFLLIEFKKPGTLQFFLESQLLNRIKGGSGHKNPIYYFFIVLPLGFLPWTLFLPNALAHGLGKEASSEEKNKIHFLLLAFLIPFILFSLFKSKLATYVVPLFPFLSILAAYFWKEFLEGKITVTRTWVTTAWAWSFIYLIIPVAGLVFIRMRPEFVGGISEVHLALAALLMAAAWVSMALVLLMKKYRWIFPLQVAISLGVSLVTFSALPQIKYKNAKVFAEKIQELRKPGDIVLMYERYFASLPFYLNERVLNIGGQTEAGQFDADPLMPKFYIDDPGRIKEFAEGRARILALTNEDGFAMADSISAAPLYILFEQQGYILFSNRAPQ